MYERDTLGKGSIFDSDNLERYPTFVLDVDHMDGYVLSAADQEISGVEQVQHSKTRHSA